MLGFELECNIVMVGLCIMVGIAISCKLYFMFKLSMGNKEARNWVPASAGQKDLKSLMAQMLATASASIL